VGDRKLKDTFKQSTQFEFWSPLRSEYPEIAKYAVQLLRPFVSIYHCEAAFTKYTLTKTKQRNRLDPEAAMWVKTSNIRPDFKQGSQCTYNMQTIIDVEKQ